MLKISRYGLTCAKKDCTIYMWICAYKHKTIQRVEAMQDLIKTMKALSDETRLRILNLLMERECCVCEVMQALDISQTRASRNLGILQDAGFLKARREGLWIAYSIDWQTTNPFVTYLAKLLRDSPTSDEMLEKDKERLKHSKRIGPGCRQNKTKNV